MTKLTEDEARDKIIEAARFSADYWLERVPADYTSEQRVTGAIFAFLCCLDGVNPGFPACDICVLDSDDESGKTIGETRVSTMLHEFLYSKTTGDRRWRKL